MTAKTNKKNSVRSASIEDYIKTVYALESAQERASTKRIAAQMSVKMASVTGMIKHLASEGYVKHKPYYGVKLTDRGRKVALEMLRRHRLIELFLSETLGLSWDEVDDDAEVLEHAVSDRLIERIHEFLGRPEFDPHGSPIPRADGTIRKLDGVPLADLGIGKKGKIAQVDDSNAEFLRYLTKLGLKIGSRFTLVERSPFDGLVTLRVGKRNVVLGREAARSIQVKIL